MHIPRPSRNSGCPFSSFGLMPDLVPLYFPCLASSVRLGRDVDL